MLFTSVAKKAYNITSKSICCLLHPFPDEKIPKYCCIGNYGLMIAEVVAVVAAEEASVIEEIAQTASIHVIEEEAEVATVGETGDLRCLSNTKCHFSTFCYGRQTHR